MCYHYTTGQFLIATAKVMLFLLLASIFSTFFQFFFSQPSKTAFNLVRHILFSVFSQWRLVDDDGHDVHVLFEHLAADVSTLLKFNSIISRF